MLDTDHMNRVNDEHSVYTFSVCVRVYVCVGCVEATVHVWPGIILECSD